MILVMIVLIFVIELAPRHCEGGTTEAIQKKT
jgi:hypothetical protein